MIDKWIEYLKDCPINWWNDKIIDECDWREENMNAVHVAVIRNKVQILQKLFEAGASMYIFIMYVCNKLYVYMIHLQSL